MPLGKSLVAALCAGFILSTVTVASAAVIDFTSSATGTSGTEAGVGWSMSGAPVQGNNTQAYDGGAIPTETLGLAFEQDGAGVKNDEISFGQSLTITFAKPVRILAFAFLDLFEDSLMANLGEIGVMTVNGVEYAASHDPLAAGGYAEFYLPIGIVASSATFTVRDSNDRIGLSDGALAALQFDALPVPLPASGLMLLAGLAGVGALRRRRT